MKKEKKVKKKIRIKVLIFLILILYLIGMCIYYIFNMNIKDIIISGNNILNDSEVLEIIKINNKTNNLSVSRSKLESLLESNPYIKEAKITKSLLGNINIIITENKVLFYNNSNEKLILEGNNEVEYSKETGVPTLINYTPDNLYEELIVKLAELDQNLINKISEIEYAPNIKEDQMLDEERFIFKMNDGNTVHVNLVNFDKFSMYNDIMEIQKEKGTLYLDSSNSGHIFDVYEEVPDELPEQTTPNN